MRTSSIPIMHTLLKEYIKEEMRKGTYKEIPFQQIELIPYDELEMVDEMETESDYFVCCIDFCVGIIFTIFFISIFV